jgi:hypothetical protein
VNGVVRGIYRCLFPTLRGIKTLYKACTPCKASASSVWLGVVWPLRPRIPPQVRNIPYPPRLANFCHLKTAKRGECSDPTLVSRLATGDAGFGGGHG